MKAQEQDQETARSRQQKKIRMLLLAAEFSSQPVYGLGRDGESSDFR
jgi:hypothetical protein